jgi:uncharacterized surface protein with fasciclin (FAS1) repeats
MESGNWRGTSYVLLISALLLVGVCMGAEPAKVTEMNIVDTANASGNFTELVGAIETAGLVDTLSAPGSLTVFAPNDDAFFKIPNEDYKALLENTTNLKKILTFHVVNGKIMSKDLKDGQELTTLQGQKLMVKVGPEGVTVNGAKVVQADIEASNGVIHVIDTVLMPK